MSFKMDSTFLGVFMRFSVLFITLIFLLACKENQVAEPVINSDLYGSWVVYQYILTNGPICYDVLEGDTVSFQKIEKVPGAFIYKYTLFENLCIDTFYFESASNRINSIGNYLHADSIVSGPYKGRMLKQTLDIEILPNNQIESIMKVENYYLKTNDYIFGDVSHYKARKISNI